MGETKKVVTKPAGAESGLNAGLGHSFTTVVAEGVLESWLEPHHITGVERGSLKPFVCAIARREGGACSVMTVLEGAILALNGKHITISITVRPNV
jgi:hypothetical protein